MKEASLRRDWETLRDVDRQLGSAFQDQYLSHKLYFGTPFKAYRQLLGTFFSALQPPESFFLCHRWRNQPIGPRLEIRTGELDSKEISIKPGALLHRLLKTLTTDFYRPFSVGTLFSKLFPNEHFHPLFAADRVAQSVKRLSKVFTEYGLPIEVRRLHNEYYLKVTGDATIHIRQSDLDTETEELKRSFYGEKLRGVSEDQALSVHDLASVWNTSIRTANRIIKEQSERGVLVKLGSGKNSRYRKAG